MNNRNDFQRHLSSKNVRSARSEFQAARNTATNSTGVLSADQHASSSSSMLDGEHTSTESVMQRDESNFSSATAEELDLLSITEGAIGVGGNMTNPLEDRKPASIRKGATEYEDGTGDMTQSFLTKPKTTDDSKCCPCSCACYHTTMRKYKGMWFLLCTLFILVMITCGIVLGTNEEEDDNEDDENNQPTVSPTSFVTIDPTRNVVPTDNSYWCGTSKQHAKDECGVSCSTTQLDSECPYGQFCWSDITTCDIDTVQLNIDSFVRKNR